MARSPSFRDSRPVRHSLLASTQVVGLLAAAVAFAETAGPAAKVSLSPKDTIAYVATSARGIQAFRLDTEDLEIPQNVVLTPLGVGAETPSPSYLEIDPRRRVVFAANDVPAFQGKPTGAVSAFSVDAATGKLTLLNQRPSMGAGPCHLSLDRERRNLLVSNCGAGSVAVLPVAADGKLGGPSEVVQHKGTRPHTQGVTLSPDNRFAFACDAGLDRIVAYRFDASRGKLTPSAPPTIALKPGSGPARLVFRPDGRFAYVLGGKSSTIVTFSYDARSGALKELQTISTLPPWFDGTNSATEIAVHPKDSFLFASNRGHNTVVLFSIDPGKGTLTYVEDQDAGGKTPRHFGLDPTAEHLAIANQESDNILLCRIDGGTGRLKPSGVFTAVPAPACVKFLPPRQ